MEISNLSTLSSSSSLPFFNPLQFRRFSTKPTHLKPLPSPNSLCNIKCFSTTDSSESKNRMFIFGLGFVGQFFAKELQKENWHVAGTCRSVIKKQKLEEMGFDVQLYINDTELKSLTSLELATHILVSIPPVVGLGDPVLNQYQDLLISKVGNGNLQWLCYLSSTSVYGDCSGAWVDEDYPANPTKESARARLVAEERWLNVGHGLGVSAQVLRLGGIYGPGRSALETIIKQELLTDSQKMREARRYTSRIHVDDICQALKASIDTPSYGRINNVVDDDPAPRAEVFAFARELIEKRWPGKIKPSASAIMSESSTREKPSGGEKRVSNARLKNELGVRLIHPTYRSGLESIIKSIEDPFQ